MSTSTALVWISDEPPRALTSKRTGNEFHLYTIYVRCSAPFPEKVSVFEDPGLPKGYYSVPFSLHVRDERLQVTFDWRGAEKAES